MKSWQLAAGIKPHHSSRKAQISPPFPRLQLSFALYFNHRVCAWKKDKSTHHRCCNWIDVHKTHTRHGSRMFTSTSRLRSDQKGVDVSHCRLDPFLWDSSLHPKGTVVCYRLRQAGCEKENLSKHMCQELWGRCPPSRLISSLNTVAKVLVPSPEQRSVRNESTLVRHQSCFYYRWSQLTASTRPRHAFLSPNLARVKIPSPLCEDKNTYLLIDQLFQNKIKIHYFFHTL